MNPSKPTRAAIALAAAIAVLGMGCIALFLYLRSNGMGSVSMPAETGSNTQISFPGSTHSHKDQSSDSLTEEDLEYVPSPKVLASESTVAPAYSRKTNYRYNAAGLLVQEDWNNGVIIHYEYYDNGNRKSEVKRNSENLLYEFTYREDGTPEQQTEYMRYADGTLSSTTVYRYDERGNLYLYEDVDAEEEYRFTIHYNNEYDSHDRLIRQETINGDGTLLHVDVWDYHDSGWILDSTEYNGDPNDNPVWRHEILTYDADGKLLSIRRDISDMYPSQDLQTYTYDEYGNLTAEEWVTYPMQNEDYIRYRTDITNTYENGLLVRTETVYSETSLFEGEYTENPPSDPDVAVWEYDAEGNLVFHDDGTTTHSYAYLPLEQVLFS